MVKIDTPRIARRRHRARADSAAAGPAVRIRRRLRSLNESDELRIEKTMYTIGRLAKHARVNTDSVRFYERQGLIAPNRKTSTGYRLYDDEALRRIEFIKHAQRCGFSLADIRELLDMRAGLADDPQDVSQYVYEKQAEIEKTMSALKSMSALLSELAATIGCTGAWDEGVFSNAASRRRTRRHAPPAPETDCFRSRT